MVEIEANPLYFAATGGLIIGIATSLHYVLKGNITGMSGIVFGIASLDKTDIHNKMSIVGGMFVASAIFFDIFRYGTYNKFTPFGPQEQITEYTSYFGFALGGLLVGFGTKLGNGCTSGHGLCGLARLSIRSFIAVIFFLISAMAIGTIRYYLTLGPFTDEQFNPQLDYNHLIGANMILVLGIILLFMGVGIQSKNFPQKNTSQLLRENLISFVVGFLFATGLVVAGMCRRRNILQFLWIGKDWNPSLLFVLGCGAIVNLIVFQYMIRVKKVPYYGEKLFDPAHQRIDWKLVVGSICFGLGWGIGGLCPGPSLALFPVFTLQINVVWFICMLIGMYGAYKLDQLTSLGQISQQFEKKSKLPENTIKVSETSKIKIYERHSKQNIQIEELNNDDQN